MNFKPVLAGVVAAVESEGKRLHTEFFRRKGPRGRNAKAPIDTEIELRLRDTLQALVPGTFLGEETGMTPGALEDWVWLVDPQDGTREFLLGRRGSSVSVALLRGNVPVLGVVHCPLAPDRGHDTIAWAQDCGPIQRNGQPITVDLSKRGLDPGEFVWTTASSAFRPEFFSRATAPARYIPLPSIAYRLARIAAGDGVATLSTHGVNEYDIAGGMALILAAGGVLLNAEGEEIVLQGKHEARVTGCFAGNREAALRLSRFDWSQVQKIPRKPARLDIPILRANDEARLARAQGCLLGQVIGDSLGSLVEFRSAAEIRRAYPQGVLDLADGGTWTTLAGQPTDDSELAITLARSLVHERKFDAAAVMERYREWMASGPFDIGATIRGGLLSQPNPDSQANGSLMRVSPLGVWAARDAQLAADVAREDSALTHPHPVCVEACAGYAAALATGIEGGRREAMIEKALSLCSGPAQDAIGQGAAGERPAGYETNAGWVLIALQNAFFQLVRADSFEQGLIDTVNAGGDTDTNGAIAGALLGALHGREAVPRRWMLPVLACRPLVEAGAKRPRPMEYWPDDALELAEALLRLA